MVNPYNLIHFLLHAEIAFFRYRVRGPCSSRTGFRDTRTDGRGGFCGDGLARRGGRRSSFGGEGGRLYILNQRKGRR